jgi:hypothetical protein
VTFFLIDFSKQEPANHQDKKKTDKLGGGSRPRGTGEIFKKRKEKKKESTLRRMENGDGRGKKKVQNEWNLLPPSVIFLGCTKINFVKSMEACETTSFQRRIWVKNDRVYYGNPVRNMTSISAPGNEEAVGDSDLNLFSAPLLTKLFMLGILLNEPLIMWLNQYLYKIFILTTLGGPEIISMDTVLRFFD